MHAVIQKLNDCYRYLQEAIHPHVQEVNNLWETEEGTHRRDWMFRINVD